MARHKAVVVAGLVMGLVVTGYVPAASATGRTLWKYVSFRPSGGNEFVAAVANPNGSLVYATGNVSGRVGTLQTMAFDTSGAVAWLARYDTRVDSGATAIAVSPDGATVFVTGHTYDLANLTNWVTIAYDAATGAQLWAVTYDGTAHGDDFPQALATSGDGATVYVTGSADQSIGAQPTTVAYDASDGSLRWTAVDPSTTFGYGEGVTVSPDGSKVLVTGPLLVGSVTQMRTWSYSTDDGAPLWADTFAGPAGGTQPSGIALSPDGARAFVAGTTLTSTKRAVVVAYDVVSGDQDWSTTTLGAAARGASTSAVATTPDGAQVIVAGSSNTSGGTDGLVAAFDSETGGESWLRTYSVSGFVQTNGAVLGLTTDGTRAYVSGGACVTAQCDVQAWLTVAYSIPDGTFQWGQRFQPSGSDDHPFGIAVTPDGSQVVVAGDSHNIASEAEGFAAVGYAG